MVKVEFKKGDLVKVIGNSTGVHYADVGMVGTVLESQKKDVVTLVEFKVNGYGTYRQMIPNSDLKVIRK